MFASRKYVFGCLLIVFLFKLSEALGNSDSYSKKELLSELIKLNDNKIPFELSKQWTDKNNVYLGDVFDIDSVDCLYFTNYAPCEFEFTIE